MCNEVEMLNAAVQTCCSNVKCHTLPLLQYKLCKVKKIIIGTKGIPHLVTHDARTIRYPDPLIKVNDTVRIDLDTGKITEFIKFDTGTSTAGFACRL